MSDLEWVTLEEIAEMESNGINGCTLHPRLIATARGAHETYAANEELRRKLEGANALINALIEIQHNPR